MRTAFVILFVALLAMPYLARAQEPAQTKNTYDAKGHYTGTVKTDTATGASRAYDKQGHYAGQAQTDPSAGISSVYDAKGRFIGTVRPAGK